MNPFERHGVEHLSASSINCFIEQPSMWVAKYLLGFKDEGPAMWRGSAVEAGINESLLGGSADYSRGRALNWFDVAASGLCDEATLKERDRVPAMLDQATLAIEQFIGELPDPARQTKVEHWLDGIDVPVIGYTDYEWPDRGLELKTVARNIPSAIYPGHARQVSLYQTASRKPFHVLYVTESKSSFKQLTDEEVALHMKRLSWYAHNIRRVLSVSTDSKEVAALYTPDLEHRFYWKSEEARRFAAENWSLP